MKAPAHRPQSAGQRGFTLIELMIVVAIIGILAAIAVPAYREYVLRARVTEGLGLAGPFKTAVTDYFASNNQFPTGPESAGIADITSSSAGSVSAVELAGNGVITITFRTTVAPAGQNTVTLTPTSGSAGVSWVCGGTLTSGLKPRSCV
jgi:type IV pilus assembly protein PilA